MSRNDDLSDLMREQALADTTSEGAARALLDGADRIEQLEVALRDRNDGLSVIVETLQGLADTVTEHMAQETDTAPFKVARRGDEDPDDSTGIVVRSADIANLLRGGVIHHAPDGGEFVVHEEATTAVMRAGADRIKQLEAENAEHRRLAYRYANRVQRLEERVLKLVGGES